MAEERQDKPAAPANAASYSPASRRQRSAAPGTSSIASTPARRPDVAPGLGFRRAEIIAGRLADIVGISPCSHDAAGAQEIAVHTTDGRGVDDIRCGKPSSSMARKASGARLSRASP